MFPIVITELSLSRISAFGVLTRTGEANKQANGTWNALVDYHDGITYAGSFPSRAEALNFICGQIVA